MHRRATLLAELECRRSSTSRSQMGFKVARGNLSHQCTLCFPSDTGSMFSSPDTQCLPLLRGNAFGLVCLWAASCEPAVLTQRCIGCHPNQQAWFGKCLRDSLEACANCLFPSQSQMLVLSNGMRGRERKERLPLCSVPSTAWDRQCWLQINWATWELLYALRAR